MKTKLPDKIFISNWIKKPDGSLVFKNGTDKSLFNTLVKNMRVGQIISFSVDFSDDQGRLTQIAKLKAGTRDLSREVGETFITTENRIKKEAGLYDEIESTYKSFANCSMQQLSDAIAVMIEQADFVNLNLR